MKTHLALLLLLPMLLVAEPLAFHRNFQDHAVLQRDRTISISGVGAPGTEVTLAISPENSSYPLDKRVTGRVSQKGEWSFDLSLPAGGPISITVRSGKDEVVLHDILVGEVWFCSGQSNMAFTLSSAADGAYLISQAGTLPHIRYFHTQNFTSLEAEQTEPRGTWKVLSPDTAKSVSAVGYFFARQLARDLQVPVGIVHASWGGVPLRAFMPREGFQKLGREDILLELAGTLANVKQADLTGLPTNVSERLNTLIQNWQDRFLATEKNADREAARNWMNPALDDSEWTLLPPKVENTSFMQNTPIGIEWFRTTIEIPAEWSGKELLLSLGAIDEVDTTYFNGVKVGSTGFEKKDFWEIPRKYAIPSELVKQGKAVIAIREINSFGACGLFGPADAWFIAPKDAPDNRLPLTAGWRHRIEGLLDKSVGAMRPSPPGGSKLPANHHCQPTTLFNALMAPWKRYAFRGEIWYQGEHDCGRWNEYFLHQPAMVATRRAIWGEDYAFLWCQVSGFERHCPNARGPEDFWKDNDPNRNHPWIHFRDMQRRLLNAIPNSGMAVTIDHGDAYDIHPRRKEEVGYRLAKEAERLCYGFKGISAGPLYKTHEIKGNELILHFDNVGTGLVSTDGRPLGCFAVAGEDGKYFWANARIAGSTVLLTAPEVPRPVKASYGAVTFDTRLNFGNADGFPASPFFTE